MSFREDKTEEILKGAGKATVLISDSVMTIVPLILVIIAIIELNNSSILDDSMRIVADIILGLIGLTSVISIVLKVKKYIKEPK